MVCRATKSAARERCAGKDHCYSRVSSACVKLDLAVVLQKCRALGRPASCDAAVALLPRFSPRPSQIQHICSAIGEHCRFSPHRVMTGSKRQREEEDPQGAPPPPPPRESPRINPTLCTNPLPMSDIPTPPPLPPSAPKVPAAEPSKGTEPPKVTPQPPKSTPEAPKALPSEAPKVVAAAAKATLPGAKASQEPPSEAPAPKTTSSEMPSEVCPKVPSMQVCI